MHLLRFYLVATPIVTELAIRINQSGRRYSRRREARGRRRHGLIHDQFHPVARAIPLDELFLGIREVPRASSFVGA